jgi:4-hydroxy-tetrahydrodipicolinate synthase
MTMQGPLQRPLPGGAYCDLITPFRNGALDADALASLVRWQIDSGIAGLVVCGQAGEATSLSRDERAETIRVTIEAAAHAVPVVAGTGTNSTATTITLTEDAKSQGADAVVIVMPYYNKPSQEGIVRHYEAIAAAVDIPIVVCNAPALTASDLTLRTLERLTAIDQVIGIQDCTGDISRLARTPLAIRKRLRHYSGHDLTALAFNIAGGAGSFSIAANIAPRFISAMHDALRTGNMDAALALNERSCAIIQILEREAGPAIIKQALGELRGIHADVRLPLTPASPDAAAAMRMAMTSLPNQALARKQAR